MFVPVVGQNIVQFFSYPRIAGDGFGSGFYQLLAAFLNRSHDCADLKTSKTKLV